MYLTPDDVALAQEAKRYAARHPMPLAPRFIGTNALLGRRSFPLLSALPMPPYQPSLMITRPVTGPKVPRGACTASPLERDYVDPPGPGLFLHGLGEVTLPAKYVVPLIAVIAGLYWTSRRRR